MLGYKARSNRKLRWHYCRASLVVVFLEYIQEINEFHRKYSVNTILFNYLTVRVGDHRTKFKSNKVVYKTICYERSYYCASYQYFSIFKRFLRRWFKSIDFLRSSGSSQSHRKMPARLFFHIWPPLLKSRPFGAHTEKTIFLFP